MTNNELISAAKTAMKSAYSPYSGFQVGAALLCSDGAVYLGSNIENASYGATVCAERVAFFKAVSEGKKDFSAIAIVGGKGGNIQGFFPPCGICCQVMREFCKDDFRVILGSTGEEYKEMLLSELLPVAFSRENLENQNPEKPL